MLKKPSVFLSSYSGLQQCSWSSPHSQINTSPPTIPPSPLARSTPSTSQHRYYATSHHSPLTDESWPDCAPPHIPTPYEIFRQQKGSKYSKRRFYELVKIYHPDRHDHAHSHSHLGRLPHSVKLERYRLIVAANEILSDPVKRSAYDRHGAGWNGQPEVPIRRKHHHHDPNEAQHRWTSRSDDTPFHNATWEDWERWYRRHEGKGPPAPGPFYMSHSAFVSFLALIVFLGAVAQATRMGTYSMHLDEKIKLANDECNRLMNSRAALGKDRHERVQHFLAARDPTGNGLDEDEEKTYRTLLGPKGVSRDETIQRPSQ